MNFSVEVKRGDSWVEIQVPTSAPSRFMRALRFFKLIAPTVSGMCPRGVHLRDKIGPGSWLTWCHEVRHYVRDYLTAPFPRLLTHPVRSLWGMRKGYRKSPREIAAFAEQQGIADGTDENIRPTAATRKAFRV